MTTATQFRVPPDFTTLLRDAQGDLLPGYTEYTVLDCVGKVKKAVCFQLANGEKFTTHRSIGSTPSTYVVTVQQSALGQAVWIDVKGGTSECCCTDSSESWITLYVCTFKGQGR
jgi:hypothetical protein